jgi:hypothetical protein
MTKQREKVGIKTYFLVLKFHILENPSQSILTPIKQIHIISLKKKIIIKIS